MFSEAYEIQAQPCRYGISSSRSSLLVTGCESHNFISATSQSQNHDSYKQKQIQ